MQFFNSYTSSNYKKRDLIDSYYEKIIKVSRQKHFYNKLMVPDTIDGRFDLLILFSIIFTFFLIRTGEKGKELSQILFDKIFLDLDLSLREMGAGDTGVHVKIKKMINSYMGRQKFYMQCLEKEDFTTLKFHITKNVYRNVDDYDYSPLLLTNYCQLCFKILDKIPENSLLTNQFLFPEYKQDIN
tara:strand:- start:38 stop:592 length:555 start_codon:yes stop_codon:yes gene_type:complete